jgi:hypothetical protein
MRILCQSYDFYELNSVRSVEFAGIEFGHCSAHFLTLSFVGLIARFLQFGYARDGCAI